MVIKMSRLWLFCLLFSSGSFFDASARASILDIVKKVPPFAFFGIGSKSQKQKKTKKISNADVIRYIAQLQAMQAIKKDDNSWRIKLTQFNAKPQRAMTQTEAYLSVAQNKANVEAVQYESDDTQLVQTLLDRERAYSDTHYVFYHAQNGSLRIIQDFVRELYQFLAIAPRVKQFTFLRFFKDGAAPIRVQDFIDAQEKQKGDFPDWDDHEPELIQQLLAVNLSLYGNITNFAECTWDYFHNNQSIAIIPIREIIRKICQIYRIQNSEAISEALKNLIDQRLGKASGSLFQIFIPKKRVDDCVYLCHEMGTPYRHQITKDFDKKKKRHKKISGVLELYCKNPSAIDNIDRLQARVLLRRDILLNPNSGVAIFRHSIVPSDVIKEYKSELKKIVNEVCCDLVEKKLTHQEIVDQGSNFDIVCEYLKQEEII